MYKRLIPALLFAILLSLQSAHSQRQAPPLTRQDTLRGSITPEREWWDLTFYHLSLNTNPGDSSLEGSVLIRYKVLESHSVIQIDLQPPMRISEITQDNKKLKFKQDGNAWFVKLQKEQVPRSIK